MNGVSSIDLFLSHSSGDIETARELRAVLEEAGYSCWMAPDDVTGTEPWAQQILSAIQRSRAMLVLVSAHSNGSSHVAREVGLASGRNRAVLPIRVEAVSPEGPLEYHLAGLQRLDAFPPPISAHRDRILRRLEAILPHESVAPITEPMKPAVAVPDAGIASAAGFVQPPALEPTQVDDTRSDGSAAALAAALDAAEASVDPAEPEAAHAPLGAPGRLEPGTQIGAFTVEDVLGEGGMATVYRARQEEPRRAVALKVIRADRVADPGYRQRFLTEKDTLAALEHPSIVPIYAAGEAGGVLYIAMRLVDGPDLAAKLQRQGRMSLIETITTLEPIAEAVDYAHEMGIVHRDLKPSNIILDRHGRPYLTDFGLGKQLDKTHGLSSPGIALGTLAYMAPEQFTGITDPGLASRIDVYALACVAYVCLTGAPPFEGETPERVMYAHLYESVPNRPDLPDPVESILRRGLAKNPSDRFASGAAFISALASAQAATQDRTAAIVVPPGRPGLGGLSAWARANSMLAGAGATIAALLVVATIAVAMGGPTSSNSPGPAGTGSGVVDPTGIASPGPSVAPPATDPPDATLSPTDPPSTLPPTNRPTKPPPTREPTPPPDRTAPTSISLSIKGSAIATNRKVDLRLQAAGATQMRLGTSSSSSGGCSWATDWIRYATTRNNFDLKGGSGAGKRWVCAEFRDGSDNRAGPTRDSVTFDNPPVAGFALYDYSDTGSGRLATCAVIKEHSGISVDLIPAAATDKDGNSSLTITSVTRAGVNYTIVGQKVNIYFDPTSNFSRSVETYQYTVKDQYGVKDSGTFEVRAGPCPA